MGKKRKKNIENRNRILGEILKDNTFKKVSYNEKKRILITGKKGIGKTYSIDKTLSEYRKKLKKEKQNWKLPTFFDKWECKINFIGEKFEDYDDFLFKSIQFKRISFKKTFEFLYKFIIPMTTVLIAIINIFDIQLNSQFIINILILYFSSIIIAFFSTNFHRFLYWCKFKYRGIVIFEDMNRYSTEKSNLERSSIIFKLNSDDKWENKIIFIEYDDIEGNDEVSDPRFITDHKIVHSHIPYVIETIFESFDNEEWINKDDINWNKIVKILIKKDDFNIRNIISKIRHYKEIYEDNKVFLEYLNIDIKTFIFIAEVFIPLTHYAECNDLNSTLKVFGLQNYLMNNQNVNADWYKKEGIPKWLFVTDGNIDEAIEYFIPDGTMKPFSYSILNELDITIDKFVNPYAKIDISTTKSLKEVSVSNLMTKFELEEDENKKKQIITKILHSKELLLKHKFFVEKMVTDGKYKKLISDEVFEPELFFENYEERDLRCGNEIWIEKFENSFNGEVLLNEMILVLLLSGRASTSPKIKQALIEYSNMVINHVSRGSVSNLMGQGESYNTIDLMILIEYGKFTIEEIKQMMKKNIDMFKGDFRVVRSGTSDSTISEMRTVAVEDFVNYDGDLFLDKEFEVFDKNFPKVGNKVRPFSYETKIKNGILSVNFIVEKMLLEPNNIAEDDISILIEKVKSELNGMNSNMEFSENNDSYSFKTTIKLTSRKQTQQ